MSSPKILIYDIETAPLVSYTWGLWEQDVALNQIKQDWHLLSWSAKWLDESEIMYADQRSVKNLEDDKELLQKIWNLLDQADVVVTQNGKKFDQKKLNARFIIHGMQPPSPYKHIDTLELAKKNFAFTSNKLEYLSDKLCTRYKKLTKRSQYSGFELWKACLAGDQKAWETMEKYNKQDVLALEELYKKLIPWFNPVNFNVYRESTENVCSCGSTKIKKNGFVYTASGKFQGFKCLKCGARTRGKTNFLTPEKRKSLEGGSV
jgi:DNA polymerase elongation subunit (family B)